MKLHVEKNGPWITVELTTDTAKKPLTLQLHENQLSSVELLVQTMKSAQKVKLTLDL